MSEIIELKDVEKVFKSKREEILLFRNVNLSVHQGESVCISGPSGAGKSTMLHIMGLLEDTSDGDVIVRGDNVKNLSEGKIAKLRRTFSFMFQNSYLFPSWKVMDNILFPLYVSGNYREDKKEVALDLLNRFKIGTLASSRSSHLSGGEKSRVSLIRALINDADIIFADEPTGSLDRDNASIVEDELFGLVKEFNKALVLVTHSETLKDRAEKIYEIKNKTLMRVK